MILEREGLRKTYKDIKAVVIKLEKKSRDYFSAKGADIYTRFVRRMFFMFILATAIAASVSLVILLISSIAKPLTKVPSVTGLNVIDASLEIQEKGLIVELDSKFDTNSVKYTVLEQYPKKGVTVKKGRTITLIVSMGRDVYTAPSLVGMPRDAAEKLLNKLNISYEITVVQTQDYAVDTVISQDIPANREMERNVKMKLLVNSDVSSSEFKVGDYSHQPLENSVKTLMANSIQPVLEKVATKNPDEDGIVLSQNIASETVVPKNSDIKLQVGVYGEDDMERDIANYYIFSYPLVTMDTSASTNEGALAADQTLNDKELVVKITLSDAKAQQQEIFNKTTHTGDMIILTFKAFGKAKLNLFINNSFIKEVSYE